jgi:3-oxoacyl-[acyl-carrier protein] reductase
MDSQSSDTTKKKVFVTGSSRGIGREIAKSFLKDTSNFVIFHGSSNTIDRESFFADLTPEERERSIYIGIDLSNLDEVKKCFDLIPADLDIFVNNAGVYSTPDKLEDILNINFVSPILISNWIYNLMKGRGGIMININSLAGIYANFNEANYCATKFGLDGFFKSLQEKSGFDKIEILQYYLGAVKTDMTKHRKDHDLLIDPSEISKIIIEDLSGESYAIVSRIIKRKKY